MSTFNMWVTEPPAFEGVGVVPTAFHGGHVLRMLYDESNQYVFTVDRYLDEAGNLLPSKLHRFNSVFDWSVGIPHVELSSGAADQQFLDVVSSCGAVVVLRRDASGSTPKYFLDKRDPYTLSLISSLEIFECSITTVTGSPYLWLVSRSGIFKRLNVESWLFDVEKSYPSNTDCGQAVYDPVMSVLIVPKKVAAAELYDAQTGVALGAAPFPWQGPDQFAHVVVPPHGEIGTYNPPVVALVEFDVGLQKSKVVLFQRDIVAKNYIPLLVEIPFCTDAIPPYGQIEGYRGLQACYVTASNRPPGNQEQVVADVSKIANRLVFIAYNGHAPSAELTPLLYFVGRRVDLQSYLSAPMFTAGLPLCNPFKRHVLTTNETAKLWIASSSLDDAEQRTYPCCTMAI